MLHCFYTFFLSFVQHYIEYSTVYDRLNFHFDFGNSAVFNSTISCFIPENGDLCDLVAKLSNNPTMGRKFGVFGFRPPNFWVFPQISDPFFYKFMLPSNIVSKFDDDRQNNRGD